MSTPGGGKSRAGNGDQVSDSPRIDVGLRNRSLCSLARNGDACSAKNRIRSPVVGPKLTAVASSRHCRQRPADAQFKAIS